MRAINLDVFEEAAMLVSLTGMQPLDVVEVRRVLRVAKGEIEAMVQDVRVKEATALRAKEEHLETARELQAHREALAREKAAHVDTERELRGALEKLRADAIRQISEMERHVVANMADYLRALPNSAYAGTFLSKEIERGAWKSR